MPINVNDIKTKLRAKQPLFIPIEAKQTLGIQELKKIEAKRPLLIPEVRKIKAK
jgi:hypothetical protein